MEWETPEKTESEWLEKQIKNGKERWKNEERLQNKELYLTSESVMLNKIVWIIVHAADWSSILSDV